MTRKLNTEAVDAVYASFDERHAAFVRSRIKHPNLILEQIDAQKLHLMHMVFGLLTELGELADPIKKHCFYNQTLDTDNVVEEMGDMSFYNEGLSQAIGWVRTDIVEQNMEKLAKRYKTGYSDKAAKERADKR